MTLTKKVSTGFATGILALDVVGGSVAPSYGVEEKNNEISHNTVNLSDSDKQQLNEFFDKAKIDSETRKNLTDKLESGEMWDSVSDTKPISSENFSDENFAYIKNTYADGSVSLVSVQSGSDTAEGVSTLQSFHIGAKMTGCNNLPGGTVHEVRQEKCLVKNELGLIMMSFYIDRTVYPHSPGKITRYYGEDHRVIGGALSNYRLEQFSDQQVRYSADISVAFEGSPVGATLWTQVTLGIGESATVEVN